MEVKPGYKVTEVGVVPDDWILVTAGEITDSTAAIRYGVVQVGPHTPSGVPIIAIKHLKNILSAPLHQSCGELEARYSKSRVEENDVLISVKGTIGHVGLVPKGFFGNISRDIARIRPSRSYSPSYVAHQLESDATQQRIDNKIVGTTRLEFSIATLRKFVLSFPPTLFEQQAIADALSDADASIETLNRLIVKKHQFKQGVMQKFLTDKQRLPGFEGSWVDTTLGTIAKIKTGSRNNEDKSSTGQYPFFVRSATVERINCYTYNCEAILIPGEGGIGSIFHYIDGKFDVHQRVYAITDFHPSVSGRFIYLHMIQYFGPYAMENSVKATVDSLRLPTFTGFQMRIPPTLPEQQAITQVLSDLDAELTALIARRDKAKLIKQGMMQELLTGKTRLV